MCDVFYVASISLIISCFLQTGYDGFPSATPLGVVNFRFIAVRVRLLIPSGPHDAVDQIGLVDGVPDDADAGGLAVQTPGLLAAEGVRLRLYCSLHAWKTIPLECQPD